MRTIMIALACVTVALTASLCVHASVNCRDCEPAFWGLSNPSGAYSIGFEPGSFTSSERGAILDGASYYWNAVFGEHADLNISVSGTEGNYDQAPITFYLDETLHGTTTIAVTQVTGSDATAVIGVNPDYLGGTSSYNFLAHIGAHEVGHAFDYKDVRQDTGCSEVNTIMFEYTSPNVGFPALACSDEAATEDKYYGGTYDYCMFGCPPGYTETCVGDQQPDPSQCYCCINYSPIVIDLDGHGFSLSSAEAGAVFAINDVGSIVQQGWPNVGTVWLARDINGNGRIDDGSELFGNTTRLEDGRLAPNGYVALAEYDTNHDGIIDSKDGGWPLLVIWSDLNRNAFTDAGELTPLVEAGILRLDLRYHESRRQDRWGNRFRYSSDVLTSRGLRHSADVYPVTSANNVFTKFVLVPRTAWREGAGRSGRVTRATTK